MAMTPLRIGRRRVLTAVATARHTTRAVREWVDHTSELELHVEAPSAEAAVGEATAALGEILGEPTDEPVTRALEVEGRDAPGLLAAWPEELVFLAEQDELIAQDARDGRLEDTPLRGRLAARAGRPAALV